MDKKIWVFSDSHFNHEKSFILEPRGCSSAEEMNALIVKNYNQLVAPDDIVYWLGDVAMGTDYANVADLVSSMNGHKYLAIGNHDTDKKIAFYKEHNLFEDIQFGYRVKFHKKSYILTHYPTLTDNGDEIPMVRNVHGHTHSDLVWDSSRRLCYNACLEANEMRPVSLEEIHNFFKRALA